ncbi:MAG: hypothetical protein LH605_06135, partial [Microbacteriaceae bacterium]|nr:hypothetical protein [Microbacteriaceae bacterium]
CGLLGVEGSLIKQALVNEYRAALLFRGFVPLSAADPCGGGARAGARETAGLDLVSFQDHP